MLDQRQTWWTSTNLFNQRSLPGEQIMDMPNFGLLDETLRSKTLSAAKQAYLDACINSANCTDLIRSHLDLQLRSQALQLGKNDATTAEDVQVLLDFVVALAKEDLCVKTLTVGILQDIFDVSSKRKCEEFFRVVEKTIATWKTPFFFDACKNSVLRMCNDLLKRLSQTVETTFCGRILILLAKALPLNERSGLNLMSQMNTSNVTTYDKDIDMKEEGATGEEEEDVEMEMGEIREQKDLKIDYELYVKFWKLQQFFVAPNQAYNQDKWLAFESNLTDVLSVFSTYKLERTQDEEISSLSKTNALDYMLNGNTNGITHNDAELSSFSAKYLTNQKLFHLQIADSQFRRYFLSQCLIFINYLLNPNIKFRDATLFLIGTQEKVLDEWSEKCYQLLRETYPHGARFAESLKTIFKNDKIWSDWKNDGCPDLVTTEMTTEKLVTYRRREVQPYNPDITDLGNQELTRLWNINYNNLDSCKAESRIFDNVLETVLDEVLDEIDPEQQIEENYMKLNDEKYQWTCSRFLLYNHYQNYTKSSTSTYDSQQGKVEAITTNIHLRNALLGVAKGKNEYKKRAVEIEERLAVVARKKAEKDAQEAKAAAEAKALTDAKTTSEAKTMTETKATLEVKEFKKRSTEANKKPMTITHRAFDKDVDAKFGRKKAEKDAQEMKVVAEAKATTDVNITTDAKTITETKVAAETKEPKKRSNELVKKPVAAAHRTSEKETDAKSARKKAEKETQETKLMVETKASSVLKRSESKESSHEKRSSSLHRRSDKSSTSDLRSSFADVKNVAELKLESKSELKSEPKPESKSEPKSSTTDKDLRRRSTANSEKKSMTTVFVAPVSRKHEKKAETKLINKTKIEEVYSEEPAKKRHKQEKEKHYEKEKHPKDKERTRSLDMTERRSRGRSDKK